MNEPLRTESEQAQLSSAVVTGVNLPPDCVSSMVPSGVSNPASSIIAVTSLPGEPSSTEIAAEPILIEPTPSWLRQRWAALEVRLEAACEHLNPILIKEARQALKSRQFTITFALVLGAAWIWSLLGLALIGPRAYYASEGPDMLLIYYFILAFPLLVIVPYGAFRSLAGELEDRTYELLAITTLQARQIIGGKLASSVLQMLVYLSAIAPCIAFTYLLRGVDMLTLLMLVGYTTMASLAFSLIGLLIATCAMDKYRQVVASVLLVLMLGGAFLGACGIAGELISSAGPVQLRQFLLANAMLLTAYVSYLLLAYLGAAAQLSFPASNRSTGLRIVLVLQQALFCGWICYIWQEGEPARNEYLMVALLMSFVHWYVAGAFTTGEPAELSPRVQRDLPSSFFGRAFLTWFNPGPGTGYMLSLASYSALAGLVVVAALGWPSVSPWGMRVPTNRIVALAAVCLSFLTVYLGLGKLILSAARRAGQAGVVLRVLVHVLILAIGAGVPVAIQLSLESMRNLDYTLLQITNPFWTITAVADGKASSDLPLLLTVLPVAAVLVLLANLPEIVREVQRTRMAKPTRVAEEDLEQQHEAAPPKPTSPWG